MANERMTLVASIHQPSSRIFYSFDRLIVLADGRTIYNGAPAYCLSYLSKLHYTPPNDYNPADFLMDLVTWSYKDSYDSSHRSYLIRSWDTEYSHAQALRAITPGTHGTNDEDEYIGYSASYGRQFMVLYERALILTKESVLSYLQFFQAVFIGVISGLIWWQMPYSESSVNDRAGFLFFFVTFW